MLIENLYRQPLQTKGMISNPGPGQYHIPGKFVESAKYSFGLKNDLNSSKLSNTGPGPGSYSPDKLKKNDSKYSFGIKSNKELLQKKNYPSPGDYEISSFLSQTHGVGAFSRDMKLKDNHMYIVNPGPGAYDYSNKFKAILK